MSVDLTDPDIASTYDNIIKGKGKDWLLLSYGKTRDRLSLLASGEGDFDDLCRSIPRVPEDVYFAFCRERDGATNYFALIAFVPGGVSGVRRARALVHSRAVGSLFKAANISMNVSDLSNVSTDKLRERLQLGPSLIPRLASNNSRAVLRSLSMPHDPRSSSESSTYSSGFSQSPRVRGNVSESQGRRSSDSVTSFAHMPHIPSEFYEDRAPPTPPKDLLHSKPTSAFVRSASLNPEYMSSRARAHAAVSYMSDGDEVVISPRTPNAQRNYAQSRAIPRTVSLEEKARRRLEVQKQREAEELQAQREEAERQARLRREKEDMLRQVQEEEDYRLAKLEEEKRHALAERARREKEVQLEEERRIQEMELRKQRDRERRMEQTRRIELERQEAERRAVEAARKREEDRRLSDLMRRRRMREIQEKFARAGRSGADPVLLTGVVTVQTSTSISWKRRFFELTETALTFYRDSQDRTSPLDIMSLAGERVAGIKEPQEGYDELEAIPHSFAVEFADGDGAWSMFTDSAEDKDILVSLLSQAAGL